MCTAITQQSSNSHLPISAQVQTAKSPSFVWQNPNTLQIPLHSPYRRLCEEQDRQAG